jgi:Xaa-Pro dipeptidase
LGLPGLTRRFLVLLPATGSPIALTHRIEQQPWQGWIGENRVYSSHDSFQFELRRLVEGCHTVAVEYSPMDAVPYLDRVPAGVLELLRESEVELKSSGDLVSAVYARWSPEGLASHHRAAKVLREAAYGAFDWIGERLRRGSVPTEWEVRGRILEKLVGDALRDGADAIVAVNGNAANPHYAPTAERHASIARGDVVLIDLWGKESAEAIYADQTWMAFVGSGVPAETQRLWTTIRDARNAAVEFLRAGHAAGRVMHGYEVDEVARQVVVERGLGDAFFHRTGHSIDRDLHGSGPNIDSLETRDSRRLIDGVGFSIEPGVYLPDRVGLRTEINVYMAEDGPVVTTPEPQDQMYLIDVGALKP